MQDIFTVFVSTVLPALADPGNAYNKQHIYILSSLAEYKSICLITDLNNADSLVTSLFSTCFDIISSKGPGDVQMGKTVEFHLNNLLAVVVDEVGSLPQEVTDIIISQFLRVEPRAPPTKPAKRTKSGDIGDDKQDTLMLKEYPPAYNLAKAICTACSEKMTTQISQYFSNVIVDAASSKPTNGVTKHVGRRFSEIDDDIEDEEEDTADLHKAHRLIRELWRACPDVLTNVIPQIEAELHAESVPMRSLAVQTLGDVVAGIGISGLPPSITLDPAAYPLPTLETPQGEIISSNQLLMPRSPKPFTAVHHLTYDSFLKRRQDKSAIVRAYWATAVGRILLTSAGGIGLSESEQDQLLAGLAHALEDSDERVRIAAIEIVSAFSYHGVVNSLGAAGGIDHDGSVLATLAARARDRKHAVRAEAITVLSRMWGVASRDIGENNEKAVKLFGEVPSRILDVYFTNEPDIHELLDKVIFESFLPLSFPPLKGSSEANPDAIRAGRILTFVRSLNDKTKQVFFAIQARQTNLVKVMDLYLKTCEDYNGGVMDENEEDVKARLTRIIDPLSKMFPEPSKVSADLWKFAKMHDRRNYQLIRFCLLASSDYRTVTKAIKELTKRIQSGPTNTVSLLETITPLLYRCALLVYNRSHVPAIMEIARSSENGLSETAHEILKQISSRNPEVLKTHINDMCKELEKHAPTASRTEDLSAADSLKACAAFARKFPDEVSKERKFLTALTNYALFGSPRGSKHAVSIIMTVADKKEMYANEIVQKALKGWKYGAPHFLARLAAVSQISLLAPAAAKDEEDQILQIAVADLISQNQSGDSDQSTWSEKPSEETTAKELALKLLVNRCRSEDDKADPTAFDELVNNVYVILMKLVESDGEYTETKDTPKAQRSRLKLIAVKLILKLCKSKRRCEELVAPAMFNSIARTLIQKPHEVRSGVTGQLKKYLGQDRLNQRWFTPLFLLAFDPHTELRTSTVTWLKSRVQSLARQQQQAKIQGKRVHENVMEALMARLISFLAHHPDYPQKDAEEYDLDLVEFCKYFVFYLQAVANEDNLSLIYHVAQRPKQARDAVSGTDEVSERLYVLSDLAQATIRNYADLMPAHAKGINLLQALPYKIGLPASLFSNLRSAEDGVRIREQNFLSEDVEEELAKVVRVSVKGTKSHAKKPAAEKPRKRKSESVDVDVENEGSSVKKVRRSSALPVRKASKPAKTPSHKRKSSSELPSSEMPSRKSTRVSASAKGVSYADGDSDAEGDDDEEEAIDDETPAPRSKSVSKAKPKTPVIEEQTEDEAEDFIADDQDDQAMSDPDDEKENPPTKQGNIFDLENDEEDEPEKTSPLKEKANRNGSAKKSWADIGLKGNGKVQGKAVTKKAGARKQVTQKTDAKGPAAVPPVANTRAMRSRG
jgi:sister-chromatid-cohesion protein PDS5